MDQSAGSLEEPPADGGHPMPLPAFTQGGVFEEDEKIVGNDVIAGVIFFLQPGSTKCTIRL